MELKLPSSPETERIMSGIMKILARLYKSFPYPAEICLEDFTDDPEEEDFYHYLIVWLKDEGFIRFSRYDRYKTFHDTVLTSKGLNLRGEIERFARKEKVSPDRFHKALCMAFSVAFRELGFNKPEYTKKAFRLASQFGSLSENFEMERFTSLLKEAQELFRESETYKLEKARKILETNKEEV